MPRLFSYGTLQQEEVQLSTFGRKLDGEKDLLTGYEPSLVKIADPAVASALGKSHHDNITATGDDWSNVQGTVFEVTDAELAHGRHLRSAVRLQACQRHPRVGQRRVGLRASGTRGA